MLSAFKYRVLGVKRVLVLCRTDYRTGICIITDCRKGRGGEKGEGNMNYLYVVVCSCEEGRLDYLDPDLHVRMNNE